MGSGGGLMDKIGVVITTEHRGVFFGYIDPEDKDKKTISVEKCRMCVYWSSDVHGVVGLAANGPATDCKITPATKEIILQDITAVMVCEEDAIKAWEKEPWN